MLKFFDVFFFSNESYVMKFTFRNSVFLLAVFAALLSGCAVTITPRGVVTAGSPAPSKDETVVVYGANHIPDFHYIVVKGDVSKGVFEPKMAEAEIRAAPVNGYLIGKVQAGESIALISVNRYGDLQPNSGWRDKVIPCSSVVQVFRAVGGKVIYASDVQASITDQQRLRIVYSSRFSDAESYLDKNLPALRGLLERAAPTYMPYKCPPEYIQVWIPKKG